MEKVFWRWIVLLTTIITIAINSLANIVPFNGKLTGDISDSFFVYFVPAGYVFSIWGLIYIGIAAYAVYQVLPKMKSNALLTELAPWVILGNVANAMWIFFWHYDYPRFTVVIMLVLLVSLIMVCTSIWSALRSTKKTSAAMTWAVRVPFEIYLGWISVATIANIAVALYVSNWSGFDIEPSYWAVIMLVVATVLGFLLLWMHRAYAAVLVLVWAFIGIAVKFMDVQHEYIAAILCVIALVISMGYFLMQKKK